MLKDVVLDHRLPVAAMLSETAMGGAMTPGGGAATPYIEGGKTPMPQMTYEQISWSPMHMGSDETFGGTTQYGGYGMTPLGGGVSPGCQSSTCKLKNYLILDNRLSCQSRLCTYKSNGNIWCWN